MTRAQMESLAPALDAYLAEFGDVFGRSEPRAHLARYVRGQLSDLPRKSVEPIALAQGVAVRHFCAHLTVNRAGDFSLVSPP